MADDVIPPCYFPSTVMFIDDKRSFLYNLSLGLPKDIAYEMYNSPLHALKVLESTSYQDEAIRKRAIAGTVHPSGEPLTDFAFEGSADAVSHEVYNQLRFQEITVVIVDYNMPDMNGLEFCKKIDRQWVKLILLTSQSDSNLAIDALNRADIDYYIQKQQPNLGEIVSDQVHKLQKYIEFAKDCNVSSEIIARLTKGEIMPFLLSPEIVLQGEIKDWSTYLYPANKLEGDSPLYYNYIHDKNVLGLDEKRITSYRDYCNAKEV